MDYEKLKIQLIKHEGYRKKPYKCTAGKLTIGVGRNLDDVGLFSDEINLIFENDIKRCEIDLQKNLSWFESQPENVKMVLIDMCFNLGIYGLLKFKNTLSLISKGKYNEASIEMLNSNWAMQVGVRAVNLSQILKNERTF